MKSKSSGLYLGLIVLILVMVVWKLNVFYKTEKSSQIINQIHQQNLNVKAAVSTQLSQLRNALSSYQGQINESQINWVQLNPFFALAQGEMIPGQGFKIKNLFLKSGTAGENWSNEFIQKAVSYGKYSKQPVHVQMFQNKSREKFMALVFLDEKNLSSNQATLLIGDASYFQHFFDVQRAGQVINALITNDKVVAGHSQADYVATKTKELEVNPQKYFFEKDEIRSTNLIILSYISRNINQSWLAIPPFISLFILGVAFLAMGLVLIYFKPQVQTEKKAEIFKKVFDEVQQKSSTPIQNSALAPVLSAAQMENKASDEITQTKTIEVKNLEIPQVKEIQPQHEEIKPVKENILSPPVRIELQKVVSDVIDSFQNQTQVHFAFENLSLKKHEIDVVRFKKALVNIIQNSIDAQATQIDVKIFDLQNDSCIEISDNGFGFLPGAEEKFWQPYYTTKDKLKHKGLGLPEALSVLRRYGGEISIQGRGDVNLSGAKVRIYMNAKDMESLMIKNDKTETISETVSWEVKNPAQSDIVDIDLDGILKLDDVFSESDFVKKELTPQHFKIETTESKIEMPQVQVQLEPKINIAQSEKKIFDNIEVKIRRPGKS